MLQYLPIIGKVIDKVWPDPTQAAEARLKLMEMEQAGEFKEIDAQLQRDLAQLAVNKAEAESPSLFKGGWRPAIGWSCAVGFMYIVILQPALNWAAVLYGIAPPPTLEADVIYPVLLGMLGLGGMRSYERMSKVIPHGK